MGGWVVGSRGEMEGGLLLQKLDCRTHEGMGVSTHMLVHLRGSTAWQYGRAVRQHDSSGSSRGNSGNSGNSGSNRLCSATLRQPSPANTTWVLRWQARPIAPGGLPRRRRTCSKCFLLAVAALEALPSPLIVWCGCWPLSVATAYRRRRRQQANWLQLFAIRTSPAALVVGSAREPQRGSAKHH